MKVAKRRGIYSITNNLDGQYTTYIGSTKQAFCVRWATHKSALRHKRHDNDYLQRAWDKYGEKAFSFDVVEIVDNVDDIAPKECMWLDFYRMYVPVYNLSLSIGTDVSLGHPHDEETKEKIRSAVSGENHYMYGKKLPEKTRGKISDALSGENNPFYGCKHSRAAREKMSAANKGENHPCYGKHLPASTRNKIGRANSKPHPAFRHSVTGEIIPAGTNLWGLCKNRGLHYSGMYWLAHGKQKICKGWVLNE